MRKLLQEHSLFKNLSPEQIDRLTSRIARRVANRGATIFAKGDPGSTMFTICDGVVKIGIVTIDGHEAVFDLLGRGDIFWRNCNPRWWAAKLGCCCRNGLRT